jgi:hypothetical protein
LEGLALKAVALFFRVVLPVLEELVKLLLNLLQLLSKALKAVLPLPRLDEAVKVFANLLLVLEMVRLTFLRLRAQRQPALRRQQHQTGHRRGVVRINLVLPAAVGALLVQQLLTNGHVLPFSADNFRVVTP